MTTCWRRRWTLPGLPPPRRATLPRSGLPTILPGPPCCLMPRFRKRRWPAVTIWNGWPIGSGQASNRWRIGCLRCNVRGPRVSRSSSCASIRRALSPNATLRRVCNLPGSAAPASYGTCTAHLKLRAGFCGCWQRRPTVCGICALRATCPNPAGRLPPRCGGSRSDWVARSPMPRNWFMPTGWTSGAHPSRSAFPAGSASGKPAIKDQSRRWNDVCGWILTAAIYCHTPLLDDQA